MPEVIDLDADPVDPDFLSGAKAKEGTGIKDYGHAVSSGIYGVGGSLASGADYLLDTEDDSVLKGVRKFADEGAKFQIQSMSEGARDALNSGLLPGGNGKTIWDADVSIANALGLKVANASPSLLASIIPVGLAGTATRLALARLGASAATAGEAATAVGTAAGGAVNATMMAGQVYDDIEKSILDTKDAELRKTSELYDYLRGKNFSESVARKVLLETAAGNKPALAGLVGAASGAFGAEAAVAKGAAGVAEKGALKGIKKGLLEEGAQEGVESGIQEGVTQQGQVNAGTANFDGRKLAENIVGGAVVGGAMGGAVGGVVGVRAGRYKGDSRLGDSETETNVPEVDPAVEAAAGQPPVESTPTPITPKDKAAAGLAEADKLLDANGAAITKAAKPTKGEKARATAAAKKAAKAKGVDPAIEEAIGSTEPVAPKAPEITPQVPAQEAPVQEAPVTSDGNEFVPQDEFEADPDFEPGQTPAAPQAPEAPQEPAQVAPTQAPAPQELPTQPETQPAAVAPPEATQTPTSEVISLDDVPVPPRETRPTSLDTLEAKDAAKEAGPRVLPSLVSADTGPKTRISAAERKRIAEGQGDAVTLTTDEAKWKTQADRTKVFKLAEEVVATAKKNGTEPQQWAVDVLEARGKMTGKGERPLAMRQKYMAARRALSEGTQAKVTEGTARRETAEEAEARQSAEKIRSDIYKTIKIIDETPLSKGATAGLVPAIRAHAQLILDKAKKAKIVIPGNATDAHFLYLKNAEAVVKSANKDVAHQFVGDDFFLRNGNEDELAARRKSQQKKTDHSYGEEAATEEGEEAGRRAPNDLKEGADTLEEHEASGLPNEEAYVNPNFDELLDQAPTVSEARAPAPIETDSREAVVGVNKAGTFKAEVRGRRKVTTPGNKPATLAQAVKEVNTAPTEAQKEAGNYKKARVKIAGLPIAIENPAGSKRSGTDPSGRKWSVEMPAHYGYVEGTKGKDGDPVDVYVRKGTAAGDNIPNPNVYIIDQTDLATGKFDEHKVMIGFRDEAEATEAYRKGFSDQKGDERIGGVTEMPIADFKDWLKDGDTTKPVARAEPVETMSQARDRRFRERLAERNAKQDADAAERKAAEAARQKMIEERPRKEWEIVPPKGIDADIYDAVVEPRNMLKRFINAVSDAEYKALTKTFGGSDFYGFPQSAADVSGKESADKILNAWKRHLQEVEMQPAAYGTSVASKEIEDFFGDLTATTDAPTDGTPRVTSPRSNVSVTPIVTRSLGDMLKQVNHADVDGVTARIGPFMAKRLAQMVGDIPVHVVSAQDLDALTADLRAQGAFPDRVLGYYEPTTHEIILSADAINDSDAAASHLLIHEGLHGAFMQVISRNPAARAMIEDAMQRIREVAGSRAKDHYGMTNVHEFISEAFSSQSFQEFLATIPAPSAYRSLRLDNVWQFFISGVRKFLGLGPTTDTMLDASLRIGAALTDLRRGMSDMPSSARAPSPAAMAGKLNSELREGLGDASRAVGGIISRTVLRVRTMDQLRQTHSWLFADGEGGSHLDKMVRLIQRQGPWVAELRKTGEGFSQRFKDLTHTRPEVAQESALLRNDATTAQLTLLPGKPTKAQMMAANPHVYGANPKTSDKSSWWQAKAKHDTLQERFSKLPEDVQQHMIEEAAHYRSTQDRITNKLIQNILDVFAPNLGPKGRQDLTERTMAGTLTEDDRAALNNNTFFNALKNAKELRAIKGMYFPLMRHGDYIVRTTDKIKDTMGGKEISPGVVEFRALKDKDARKASNAFASNTPLTVNRTVKRYYDPKTGAAIKPADADAGSIVAYQVTVQTEGFHVFESQFKAEKFRSQMMSGAQGSPDKVSGVQKKEGLEARGDLQSSQMAALVAAIDSRDDIPDGQKSVLKTAMGQAAVRLMSGNRIQKQSLPRQNVIGASTDYARTSLSYASSSSSYLGKLEYMPRVRNLLGLMREQARGKYGEDDTNRYNIFKEMEGRVNQNEVGINTPSPVVRDIMAVTMLSKLFSPMHSMINTTQPSMVTFPVLAGEHGAVSSALELSRAYRDVGFLGTIQQGVVNSAKAVAQWNKAGLELQDVVGTVRKRLDKAKDGAGLRKMLDDLMDRGGLDDGAQFELASAIAAGRGAFGTTIAKVDRIFRQAPASIEVINRTVTAVAAYRLAKKKGMNDQAASDYAFDTVMKSQFDYSPANASPVFNNPILRPFLQFKKYGQGMTDLYAGMIYNSFKGSTKAERRVALKQFGTLLAMQTMAAGVLSWPFFEFSKAGFILAGMLGVSDGWGEQERRLKRLADETVGTTWSELLRKGVVSRELGIDLSSRLSLADMWTGPEPKKYKASEISAWAFEQYFGASGGTIMDFRQGLSDLANGEPLKAATKLAPLKVVGDTTKAIRAYQKGDIGLGEAGVQALGAKTARVANNQERMGERIADSAKKKEARNNLRSRYLDATTAGARLKIKAEIMQYNKGAVGPNKLSIPSMERMRENNRKEALR